MTRRRIVPLGSIGGSGGGASCVCSSASAIITSATGETIALTDSTEAPFEDFHIYGHTTQDGTPTPENPIELMSAGDKGSIEISIADGADNIQTLTLSTPNGLPGIPVSSGGNYTDETGQQWVCDEIDFWRGVYVQRVWRRILDESQSWELHNGAEREGFRLKNILPENMRLREGLCNQLNAQTSLLNGTEGIWFGTNNTILYIKNSSFRDETLDDKGLANWKAHLAEQPLAIMTYLDNPIETPIPADELSAYRALHTNYPNTIIYNDEGAGQAVQYIADTKTYIDNKIASLEQALVNA